MVILFQEAQRQQDLDFSAAAGPAFHRKVAASIGVKARDALASQ
jgi:hypothetical protein